MSCSRSGGQHTQQRVEESREAGTTSASRHFCAQGAHLGTSHRQVQRSQCYKSIQPPSRLRSAPMMLRGCRFRAARCACLLCFAGSSRRLDSCWADFCTEIFLGQFACPRSFLNLETARLQEVVICDGMRRRCLWQRLRAAPRFSPSTNGHLHVETSGWVALPAFGREGLGHNWFAAAARAEGFQRFVGEPGWALVGRSVEFNPEGHGAGRQGATSADGCSILYGCVFS